MRTRSVEILPNHYYHIYNRGNNRQKIFRTAENYEFFLRRFNHYFPGDFVTLAAYCLMPNHFHLLLQILQEFDFPSRMRSFSTSFVKSFHSWYGTSGHLFEDDYQAKHVSADEHLVQVIPYIHLNPVFAGLVQTPGDWMYSDCRLWCLGGIQFAGSSLRDFLFGGSVEYRKFLSHFMTRRKEIEAVEERLIRRKSDRS